MESSWEFLRVVVCILRSCSEKNGWKRIYASFSGGYFFSVLMSSSVKVGPSCLRFFFSGTKRSFYRDRQTEGLREEQKDRGREEDVEQCTAGAHCQKSQTRTAEKTARSPTAGILPTPLNRECFRGTVAVALGKSYRF